MKEVQIKVNSVTNAVRGVKILNRAGIGARYKRSINRGSGEGCGYSIYTNSSELEHALNVLRDNSIRVYGVEKQ